VKKQANQSRTTVRRGPILIAATVAAFVSLSGIVSATTNELAWMTKDWTRWTSRDCLIVLGEAPVLGGSPWANQGRVTLPSYSDAYLYAIIQLRSALPIRQAVLRRLQLEKRYDKMNAQQKQAFDQLHADDLSEKEDRDIVVRVINGSVNNAPAGNSNSGYVDSKAVAPRQVALKLPSGPLALPIHTTVVKIGDLRNECEFVFPRVVNGKPLIEQGDSTLSIIFGAPLSIDKKTKQVVQAPFQPAMSEPGAIFTISELMYKGKLEY
jgi:hypothetical protein